MMDGACVECERLWKAYEYATQCHLMLERSSTAETGLEAIVRSRRGGLKILEKLSRTTKQHT
jgi:hypothetical protein